MPYLLFTPAVSYHVATDKPPAQNGDKFRSIFTTIYNQSQLAERKHVARYWSINTAATAVQLSAHPSPLVITTKLAAAILGGRLFGGGVLPAQYCSYGQDHIALVDVCALGVLWFTLNVLCVLSY